MKVLLLSKYDRAGASSRYRSYQFLPGLAESGIEVEEAPLLGDGYVQSLYARQPWGRRRVLAAMLNRLRCLLNGSRYDLLWVEKEFFPWMPALVESLLKRLDVPVVVDYDDAIFHNYDLHHQAAVRRILGSKIDHVM